MTLDQDLFLNKIWVQSLRFRNKYVTGIKQVKESEELHREVGRTDFQVVSTNNNKSSNLNPA